MENSVIWMPDRKVGTNIIEVKRPRDYDTEFQRILEREEKKLEQTETNTESENPRVSTDPR